MDGIVSKSMGLWYEVTNEHQEIILCRLRGKFKLQDKKLSNPIAVGDKVGLVKDDGNSEAMIIDKLYPRTNYIARVSPKKKGHSHVIASNLDQAMLIATLETPRTSFGFIDRFLVTAESFRIPAIILWNKSDLLTKEQLDELDNKIEEYEKLGYKCVVVSALNNRDIQTIGELLENKTTLFAGHSGVGKSTLINQLIPSAQQTTSAISEFANKGTHTTTFAERFSKTGSTHIIDTPGIKELGLSEIDNQELSHYFPELRALLGLCKFNNCTHIHEPGCAIGAAYEEGFISETRFESYLSMLQRDDNRR